MNVLLTVYTPEPDLTCNMAAETCVSKDIPLRWTGVPKYRALKGALASGHESVAEHASFTFAIEGISRACSHQLVRHRMASFSQQSQRYVELSVLDTVIPDSIRNHWGANMGWIQLLADIRKCYNTMLEVGIPPEDARYILPNACCTNIVVTMNARELRHFFRLRCCERAQWEIRELANRMLELCKEVAPVLFENAGPSCIATGRCPEGKKSCGKHQKDTNNVPIGRVKE